MSNDPYSLQVPISEFPVERSGPLLKYYVYKCECFISKAPRVLQKYSGGGSVGFDYFCQKTVENYICVSPQTISPRCIPRRFKHVFFFVLPRRCIIPEQIISRNSAGVLISCFSSLYDCWDFLLLHSLLWQELAKKVSGVFQDTPFVRRFCLYYIYAARGCCFFDPFGTISSIVIMREFRPGRECGVL